MGTKGLKDSPYEWPPMEEVVVSYEREQTEEDQTEGPGNVTVDEPTETSLDPEDDDLDESAEA